MMQGRRRRAVARCGREEPARRPKTIPRASRISTVAARQQARQRKLCPVHDMSTVGQHGSNCSTMRKTIYGKRVCSSGEETIGGSVLDCETQAANPQQ